MPRSKLVPYLADESGSARHDRRLTFNVERRQLVKDWAVKCGIELRIHNDGHHWRFKKGGLFGDWWPSSAKLVLQGKFDQDQHVHDYQQAMNALSKHFKKGEKDNA